MLNKNKECAQVDNTMDELTKGLEICYSGPSRDEFLKNFHDTIDAWGIILPNTDPLILDFGLDKFSEIGLIEYWIANEVKAGYCAKYLFLFDGQTCPKHCHHAKIETFFIVKGTVDVNYAGETVRMNAGDTLLIESAKYHSIKGVGNALFLEVSTPCIIEDNYFENRSIPIGGNFLR
jgi:N-acetylneuraminate synthase